MWSVIGDSFTVIYVYNKRIILETTNMVQTTVIAQVVTLLSWAEGLSCFTLLYVRSRLGALHGVDSRGESHPGQTPKNELASSGNPSESLLYFVYKRGSRKNLLPHILSSSLLYFSGDQLRIDSHLILTLLPPRNRVKSLHRRIKE